MNERSSEQTRYDSQQTQPETVACVAYDDLQSVVRNHVDNLEEQLKQLMHKYGKKNLKELTAIVSTNEMSLEDAKKYSSISKAMTEAFEKNQLPREIEKEAKLLRETALLRCKDAEMVYADHLEREQLTWLLSSGKIKFLGVYNRLGRGYELKRTLMKVANHYEYAVALALSGDFSSIMNKFEDYDGDLTDINAQEVLRLAIKQENFDVVEQILPYCVSKNSLDTQIGIAIRKLVQRKEFDRAKRMVDFSYADYKKVQLLETIARGEAKAGKNWHDTMLLAESAFPAVDVDDYSAVIESDRHSISLGIFYAEQGSIDDALRIYKSIHKTIQQKYIVRFVRALVSSSHDQEAEEIVANFEPTNGPTRKIQAYAMLATKQAEHGRNSDAAIIKALSILNNPVFSEWLHDVRVTSYLAYAHLMRGELKEMEAMLNQTDLSEHHINNGIERREMVSFLEGFIYDCRMRKVQLDQLVKMTEQIIRTTSDQDQLFQSLIDFAETVKDVGKDPTTILEQARSINNQPKSNDEVYDHLELAETYQKCGLHPGPIYDEALVVAERQDISEAFRMLEQIASGKIKNGLDFSDVTQAAYRFTSGKEMRDNPQGVWTLWYEFQMHVSAALLDKAEEIEKGLV